MQVNTIMNLTYKCPRQIQLILRMKGVKMAHKTKIKGVSSSNIFLYSSTAILSSFLVFKHAPILTEAFIALLR